MREIPESMRQSRRGFLHKILVAAGLLGAGLTLEAVVEPTAQPEARPKRPVRRPGYRETQHVREYYAKADL